MPTPTNLAKAIDQILESANLATSREMFADHLKIILEAHDREIIGSDEEMLPIEEVDKLAGGDEHSFEYEKFNKKFTRNELRAEQRQLAGLASQRALEGSK